MAKPADPDDRHAAGRPDIVHPERKKHREPAAHQRSDIGCGKRVRNRYGPHPVNPHAVGKAAGAPHNGGLTMIAELLIASETRTAATATAGIPADPDPLAWLHSLCAGAECEDASD